MTLISYLIFDISGDELNIKYGSIPISASRDGGVVFPFFSIYTLNI
jgi:hypothetical protein